MNDRLNFEAESFAVQPEFEGEFQEFAAEQSDAEWTGESGRMRRLPSRAGQSAPRFSRPTGRFSGRPSRTRPVQPSRPTLWRPRPRPYPWPPGVVVRDPYSVVREPYSVEPPATVITGSEYIRWVQDCLNRILGLWLPLTGVLGRETRSAIRSFQRQQGLAVTCIAGPETKEALNAVCGGQRDETESVEEETEEEVLGPVSAKLEWLETNGRHLFTNDEARKKAGRGVYIAVNIKGEIQKIGEAGGLQGFKGRISDYGKDMSFYLARIISGNSGPYGIAQVSAFVQYAIARTLYRAGEQMPLHGIPRVVGNITGTVNIENILPQPLKGLLVKAYPASGMDKWGQPITQHTKVLPTTTSLSLHQTPTSIWWELS